jgi:Dna[CI] antecedent, DciA
VKRELRRFGPNAEMGEVVAAWPAAVGEEIARNAWPARFQRDRTLIVHTRDAIWGFELGHRAAEISSRLPGKPALKFVPGPLPEPGAVEPQATPQGSPVATLEQVEQAARWASEIDDEELRALVARAAAASLARSSE